MFRNKEIEAALKICALELPEPDPSYPDKIKRIMSCVHKNLFIRKLSVEWLMKQCLIGDHNISSLFVHCVGCTLSHYILKHRIAAAKMLLANPQLKEIQISEIGYDVGFGNSSISQKCLNVKREPCPQNGKDAANKTAIRGKFKKRFKKNFKHSKNALIILQVFH